MSSERKDYRCDVVVPLPIPRLASVTRSGCVILYDPSGVEILRINAARVVLSPGLSRDRIVLRWSDEASPKQGHVGDGVEACGGVDGGFAEDEKAWIANRPPRAPEVPTIPKSRDDRDWYEDQLKGPGGDQTETCNLGEAFKRAMPVSNPSDREIREAI